MIKFEASKKRRKSTPSSRLPLAQLTTESTQHTHHNSSESTLHNSSESIQHTHLNSTESVQHTHHNSTESAQHTHHNSTDSKQFAHSNTPLKQETTAPNRHCNGTPLSHNVLESVSYTLEHSSSMPSDIEKYVSMTGERLFRMALMLLSSLNNNNHTHHTHHARVLLSSSLEDFAHIPARLELAHLLIRLKCIQEAQQLLLNALHHKDPRLYITPAEKYHLALILLFSVIPNNSMYTPHIRNDGQIHADEQSTPNNSMYTHINDSQLAVQLLHEAARSYHKESMFAIALLHLDNHPLLSDSPSLDLAERYLRILHHQHHPQATFRLGVYYIQKNQISQGFQHLISAFDLGCPIDWEWIIGMSLSHGVHTFELSSIISTLSNTTLQEKLQKLIEDKQVESSTTSQETGSMREQSSRMTILDMI